MLAHFYYHDILLGHAADVRSSLAFRSLACLALAQMAICPAPAVMNSSAGSVQVAAANRIQP